jgi:hypothetical protein
MSMPVYAGDTKLGRLRARHEALRAELIRGGHRSTWRELNDYLLPHKMRFIEDQRQNDAKPRSNLVLDSHATLALRTMRSGMMSGITNPARPWFRLAAPDPAMNAYGPVKQWLYEVQQRLEWIFSQSNLYKVLPSIYESIGAFGTATVAALDDFESMRRYSEFPLGSFVLSNNFEGRVDTMFREIPMTVRQVVQMFGKSACSNRVMEAYRGGRLYEWVRVSHAISPNEDQAYGSAYAKDKRYVSCWWESESQNDQQIFLRESGFDKYPLLHPRWETSDDSPYGHSAGMDVLPDVKQLQKQQLQKLTAIEKTVDPPTQGPPSINAIDAAPGGHTTLPVGASQEGIRSIYEMDFPLGEHKEDMAETRQRISRGLFEDVFMMLSQIDRAQITAYEIAERKEEKLLMLGPVLQSVNDDLLKPLVDDGFAVMQKRGIMPPAPPELQGKALRVEFISILHQAQRAVGISGIDRLLTTVVGAVQVWPEAKDKINIDETLDDIAERLGTPPKIVRGEDEVEDVRAARMQQERSAALAQFAPDVAGAMKSASETSLDGAPDGGESALSRGLKAVGAA